MGYQSRPWDPKICVFLAGLVTVFFCLSEGVNAFNGYVHERATLRTGRYSSRTVKGEEARVVARTSLGLCLISGLCFAGVVWYWRKMEEDEY